MTPRLSAIMPTADRRRFVPGAIAAFLAQGRDDCELVILDDGTDPVADLIPDDPRIRYFHETTRRALGDKRNRLCELARGDIILHWDDDDWHAPDRISRQLATMDDSGADICGIEHVVFLSDDGAQAWDYVYRGRRRWVCGGSLAYRRLYWQRHSFPTLRSGEDTRWVFNASGASIRSIDAPDLFIARVHSGNTSPKRTQGGFYRPRDPAPVREMVGRFERAAPPLPPAAAPVPAGSALAEAQPEPEPAPAALPVATPEARLRDLTIVIPSGGGERLPLLARTLAGLREAIPQSPVIVVELGESPLAAETARQAGARHIFAAHWGPFERARALNLGSAEADSDFIMWHDNDLVAPPGFYARAIAEIESAGLDFLIPFYQIHYLSEPDTRACLDGGADPSASRPLRTLRSGTQVSGGMGLVRRAFLERYGGLDERFRGWGGEDNAWWHKASVLGRPDMSRSPEQCLYHLYHRASGGLASDAARRANPHYRRNLQMLAALKRIATRDSYLARFPAPEPRPPRGRTISMHLPLWLYWEGPCPEWILRCRETILRHGGDVRLLDRAAFEALRTEDRDIDLDRLLPAHRADYARALLLARHGGIWLDSDCVLMRPLDRVHEAIAEHGFVVHKDRQGYYPNGFIAAAPGNPTADSFYSAVAGRLRAGRPLGWISLGGEPLTHLLRGGAGGGAPFHELPCEAIQPVCWSRPDLFFRRGGEAEHEAAFDAEAITYMLSNTEVSVYVQKHPGADLLAPDSFFSFILARSMSRAVEAGCVPALAEAGGGDTPASVFASYHQAALGRRDDSLSGPGSSLAQTAALRQRLPQLLAELGVGTMLDAGCGDHRWLGQTALPVQSYVGVDIVPDLIARNTALALPGRTFQVADFTKDDLPAADLIFTRDTLVHYDLATAQRALANLRRRTGARWLIATTFPDRHANRDCALGGWRPLNMTLPPFAFPPPLQLIHEGCTENGGAYSDKALGLWRMEDLPV